jgi:hypothetical protein
MYNSSTLSLLQCTVTDHALIRTKLYKNSYILNLLNEKIYVQGFWVLGL